LGGEEWDFVIIIIIILVATFMQSIYSSVPETNRVSAVYGVAAVLYLHFMLHVILFSRKIIIIIIIIIITITIGKPENQLS